MCDHTEMLNRVALTVCGKPGDKTPSDCFQQRGSTPPLCHAHGRCRLAEKSQEQLEYVLCKLRQGSFLRACPGSGKTEVVGLRAAYLVKRWKRCCSGLAVLTFTNSAAETVRQRVSQFAGSPAYPHYVGTLDAWLHGYVLNPFGHLLTGYTGQGGDKSVKLVESGATAPFLNSFATKYSYARLGSVFANQFYLDLETDRIVFESGDRATDGARNNLALESWQLDDLNDAKKRFWGSGLITHNDVEVICHSLLSSHARLRKRLSARFPAIIVDECQDLSKVQMQVLALLAESGTALHLVGDLNQAIYAFKKVDPENVRIFAEQQGLKKLFLSANLRSHQPIVDVCGKLVAHGDIRGNTYEGETPACLFFRYDKTRMPEVVSRFVAYLKTRGIPPEQSAVLARGYSVVKELRPAATRQPVRDGILLAKAIHLWGSDGPDSMDEALFCMGRYIALKFYPNEATDIRHHCRPISEASAVEWRVFLARLLDRCVENDDISDLRETWSDWAGFVRGQLPGIVNQCDDGRALESDVQLCRALQGKSTEPVHDSL
ncbi:MAG: ATP-dependent helicase, partial [Desulforhabdus sp.]|nr:ATP-dependent helicase [Desulforhabdus sp.]